MFCKTTKKKITGIISAAALLFTGCSFQTDDFFNDSVSQADNQEETDSGLTVHFIDVGQGDSSLIVCDGVSMLIDAGEKEYGDKVISYLGDLGISKLDYIVATHPHSDHMGGLAQVINTVGADTVIAPPLADESIPTTKTYQRFVEAVYNSDSEYQEVSAGDIIQLGSAVFRVIAPNSSSYEELNDYSVVGNLEYEGIKILFTGDAEEISENEMLEKGLAEDIDILKVGHHGSSSSSRAKFLEVIKPEYAVISCGADNSYNHPNQNTVKRLESYTDCIYRTDHQGTVVFTIDSGNISVDYENKE